MNTRYMELVERNGEALHTIEVLRNELAAIREVRSLGLVSVDNFNPNSINLLDYVNQPTRQLLRQRQT